jgi:predicted dehydrogenase
MGITHLALMSNDPLVEVAAIADNMALVNRVLSRNRPEIALYDDYMKMLQGEKLDLVLIASPPHLHAAMIDAALDAGLSVFVEKPFTIGAAEALRLADRSRAVRGTFQVGYVNRFNDIFLLAKRLLDQKLLGKLFSFRSDMFGRTVTHSSSGSGWRGNHATGGGCLYEFGSHALDLMVYLLGRPLGVQGSLLTSIYSESVEDIFRTTVLYPDGLAGTLNVNWSDLSYRKPANKIEVLGERGKLLADQHELKLFLNEAVDPYVKGWNTVYITDCFTPVPFYVRGNEFTRQLCHFTERVLDPSLPNHSSFADAAITQELIDMVFADARGGKQ